MQVDEAIKKRRTIHQFNDQLVDDELIIKAINSANYAPCHKLSFPWRFIDVSKSVRDLIFYQALKIKSLSRKLEENEITKLRKKFINPSHLLVLTQYLIKSPGSKSEDYAACSCAAQNFMLSLSGEGVYTKWSTGAITKDLEVYKILGLNNSEYEILGFIWAGYGEISAKIKRPNLYDVYRKI